MREINKIIIIKFLIKPLDGSINFYGHVWYDDQMARLIRIELSFFRCFCLFNSNYF